MQNQGYAGAMQGSVKERIPTIALQMEVFDKELADLDQLIGQLETRLSCVSIPQPAEIPPTPGIQGPSTSPVGNHLTNNNQTLALLTKRLYNIRDTLDV